MLDQNTTTVLTTLITVGGTLGGVVLGVVLSNRYVARQEKAKRNTAIIEEVYMDIYRLNSLVLYNFENHVLITKGIKEFDRINVLTYLYLPTDVNNEYIEYFTAIYQFANEVEAENIKDDERKNLGIFQKNHPIIFHNYIDKYNDFTTSLQRLVK